MRCAVWCVLVGLATVLHVRTIATPITAQDEESMAIAALESRGSELASNEQINAPLSLVLDLVRLYSEQHNRVRQLEKVGLGRLPEPVSTQNWIRMWTLALIEGNGFTTHLLARKTYDDDNAKYRELLNRPIPNQNVRDAWPAIAALPPIEQMGYMFQQFVDITNDKLSVKASEFWAGLEGMVNSAPVMAEIKDSVLASLKSMIYDFETGDNNSPDAQLTACHFVREQLRNRGFINQAHMNLAKLKWPESASSMAFDVFRSLTLGAAVPEFVSQIQFQMFALNSHYTPKSATALSKCEWSIAVAFTPVQGALVGNNNWIPLDSSNGEPVACGSEGFCEGGRYCCSVGGQTKCCEATAGLPAALPIEALATNLVKTKESLSTKPGEAVLGSFESAMPKTTSYNYLTLRRLLRGISIAKQIIVKRHGEIVVDMAKLVDTSVSSESSPANNFQERLFRIIGNCPTETSIQSCPPLDHAMLKNFFSAWAKAHSDSRSLAFLLAHRKADNAGDKPLGISWSAFVAATHQGVPLLVPGLMERDITSLWKTSRVSGVEDNQWTVAQFFGFWGCACKFLQLYEVYHHQTFTENPASEDVQGTLVLSQSVTLPNEASLNSIRRLLERIGYDVPAETTEIRLPDFVRMCFAAEHKPRLQVLVAPAADTNQAQVVKHDRRVKLKGPAHVILRNAGVQDLHIRAIKICDPGDVCTSLGGDTQTASVGGLSVKCGLFSSGSVLTTAKSFVVEVAPRTDAPQQAATVVVNTDDATHSEFRVRVVGGTAALDEAEQTVTKVAAQLKVHVLSADTDGHMQEGAAATSADLAWAQGFVLRAAITYTGTGSVCYKWMRRQAHHSQIVENSLLGHDWQHLTTPGSVQLIKKMSTPFDWGEYYMIAKSCSAVSDAPLLSNKVAIHTPTMQVKSSTLALDPKISTDTTFLSFITLTVDGVRMAREEPSPITCNVVASGVTTQELAIDWTFTWADGTTCDFKDGFELATRNGKFTLFDTMGSPELDFAHCQNADGRTGTRTLTDGELTCTPRAKLAHETVIGVGITFPVAVEPKRA